MIKNAAIALVAVGTVFGSAVANALTLTNDPACEAGTFAPPFSECSGSYELEGGENDVTDGGADNIVTQLLNVDEIFGDGDWFFLAKDDGGGTDFFQISGLGATSGTIEFDVAAIALAFGEDFPADYDIAISLKAAQNFSVYAWNAGDGAEIISWTTDGTATNDRGNPQALSHGSVYLRFIGDDDLSPPTGVPAPWPLALLAIGGIVIGCGRFSRPASRP